MTKREKAARALHRMASRPFRSEPTPWERISRVQRERYYRQVDTVLAAVGRRTSGGESG